MNRLLQFFLILICVVLVRPTIAQNTIGLVNYDPINSFDGYNLIYPSSQGNLYLLNNCGEIVNVWEDSVYRPGASAYLAEDGYLYITKSRGLQSNSAIHGGGAGEKVEKRDWNNNLLWTFTYNSPTYRMHHDIEVMPNGNILLIAWELISAAEAFANGRDTNKLEDGKLWPCKIVEVEPIGADSGNIVWEWRAWDHLIQDFDPTKANYGVVANNPGKINVNFGTVGNSRADWLHINSVNYNAELDQIILSVPKFDEVWIIDHSTTMQEAASSSGGLSGRGGKLLYRWGNIWAYDRGTDFDRILGFQHDAQWIDLEISPNNPDLGKIGIFNNEPGVAYSEVIVIDPVFDTINWKYPMTGNIWGPSTNYWSYTAPVPQDFYSVGLSGMQRLDNGNTLICSGRPGRLFEVDPNGNEVWKYIIPLNNGHPATQGDIIPNVGNSVQNSVFRVKRYTASHPALLGKDLSPKGYIELSPDTTFCSTFTSISEQDQENSGAFTIYPNPANEEIFVEATSNQFIDRIELFDVRGKRILESKESMTEKISVSLSQIKSGLYFLKINDKSFHKIIIN